MQLTNKNLMELSKFAIKAKKHIGLVKAAEMFHDQEYASNILVQSALSDNNDLITLTKKISNEFNIGINLIKSIETYINSLKANYSTDEHIHASKYFLIKLTHELYGINIDGVSYRQAVNRLLKNVDIRDRTFCINLARAFYNYWKGENRSFTEINSEQSLKLSTQKVEFLRLWNEMDNEFFSDSENWTLTLYVEAMREIGVSEKDIKTRQKIAKVIAVELRNHVNKLEENYRNAINNIQHLFSNQDMKEFFLIVSREYYSFWVGNIPKTTSVG